MAWKAAGRPNMAFVLLNRFLDIADAVDESEAGGGEALLEASDFVTTDIPRDAPLPAQHYCDERLREEVSGRGAQVEGGRAGTRQHYVRAVCSGGGFMD